jgi:uncharacterized protein (TIGR03435 family)
MIPVVSTADLLALAGDHLWQSTLFAVAALVVAALLKHHSASLRYWVWFAASAKFLVPFATLVAIGGYTSWRSVEIVPYREGPVLIETVGQPFSQDAVTLRPAGPRRGATPTMIGWLPTALLAIWALGAALFLLRSLVQWNRIRAIARDAVPLTGGREIAILRSLERTLTRGKPLTMRCMETFLEPGIFGIVRPVLLWPRAISERLTDEQMEAVLAHEIYHLRRGDNLAALLHLVVQTVFWFHPLVWWVGARLITERERACDEEVIRRGSERETYAESILKTCQFFVESPLACVSGVTGSDLKKRIEEIMTKESIPTGSAWKKALLTAAGIVAFVTPVAVGALNPPPQTRELAASATLPAFEEVSVRPNDTSGPGGRGGGQMQPGRYLAQNLTLKSMIRRAFGSPGSGGPNTSLDLLEQEVAGGPEWITTDKWDVNATTPQATDPGRMRLMLQRMLAERFRLRAHWEKRELPVYVLSLARADASLGAGLRRTPDDECKAAQAAGPPPMPPAGQPGQPPPPMPPPNCGAIQFGPGQLTARGAPMEWLAQTLTNVPVITGIDRPVVDRTGLKGNFGFELKFAPATSTTPDPDRPHLITALQEQLGLKLEASRAPIDVLVIDSVEKPSPN